MRLLRKINFPDLSFSLYFLRLHAERETVPVERDDRTRWFFSQSGVLELTHNWGTETDPAFKYHGGNAQPQGFGHLCISVSDLVSAVRWFDEKNVVFVKRPNEGQMKDIGFIKDPDGYWIEVIQPSLLGDLGNPLFPTLKPKEMRS